MALSGNITDFGIPDIFQLITQQNKTGSLYLGCGEVEGHIIFDKGQLVLARFTSGHDDLLLGQLLKRSGIVSEEQLKIGIENQKKTLRSLGDVLMGMRLLSPEQLSATLSLQREEVLFRIFQLKQGEYQFKNEIFKYNPKIIKPIPTNHALMDGLRMLDEWPLLEKKIGSFKRVFKLTAAGQRILEKLTQGASLGGEIDDELDMAFSDFEEGGDTQQEKQKKTSVPLNETENIVLSLADGEKDMETIIGLSQKTRFNGAAAFVSLQEKGLISESATRGQNLEHSSQEKRSSARSIWQTAAKIIIYCCSLFLLTILTVGSINRFYLISSKSAQSKDGLLISQHINREQQLLTWRVTRIEAALATYFLNNGQYPLELSQLLNESLLSEKDLTTFNNSGLIYRTRGNYYSLTYAVR